MSLATSVIIPAKNRVALLRKTIGSVLSQNIPTEIIIVDDGSQPPLSSQLKTFSGHVKIVRINKSKGSMAARNSGFQYAKGDYIAFLDSDDIWNKDFLKVSLRYLQNDQSTIATVCLSQKIYPKDWPPQRIFRLKDSDRLPVPKDLSERLAATKNIPT
ncbi:glycosyltransferase family 2 protein [Candidatus Collierbacteria bacterium]|nr:glycosyltransferase family 2 protein [Candidatus Collierbacteria bacterium]